MKGHTYAGKHYGTHNVGKCGAGNSKVSSNASRQRPVGRKVKAHNSAGATKRQY